jgi:hypothetical protein
LQQRGRRHFVGHFKNPKSQIRNPKENRNPKKEGQNK